MSEKPQSLTQAIDDAELMIEYTATRGIPLEQGVLEPIVDFAQKWRNTLAQPSTRASIPAADEVKFWVATSQLAKSIAPVTPSTLRKLQDFNSNGPRSEVGRSARWARLGVWVVLIATLLIHSYENTLGTMVRSTDDANERFMAVQSQVAAIALPTVGDEASQNSFDQAVEQSRGRYCTAARTWSIQVGIIEGLIPQGQGSIVQLLLYKLLDFLPMIEVTNVSPSGIKALDSDPEIFARNYPCVSTPISSTEVRNLILSLPLGSHEARQIMHWARVDQAFIAQFVLPLLYGMLGAFASVVRALGTAVQSARFSSASGLIYTLKVPLGALVGATIGIVIEAETLASAAGLTSLGLAFGFAYAVDVFFSFLDELMSRLSGKDVEG